MKPKPKSIQKRRTSKRPLSTSRRKVSLVHATHPVLRHFRLIEHKHTGKLLHHRHTSHLALVTILIFVGFFLYVNESVVQAETSSGFVSIGAIVPGPPPIVGAVITSPINGSKLTDQRFIDVAGTCEKDTFVVVSDNGSTAGSTICTNAGVFSLIIQLRVGVNTFSALNYDNLNQPGPVTPSVTVFLTLTSGAVQETPTPRLPINPSIIPGVESTISNCNDYKPETVSIGGEPHIAVVCITRLFLINTQQIMGILVWGGSPPYAISIDMGDGQENILLSMPIQGYKTISFSYANPGNYNVKFRLIDKEGKSSVVQTSVQVNGEVVTPVVSLVDDIFNKSWFETPVPFYLIAFAITLGFWGGDLFDRKFGAGKSHRRRVVT